MKRKYVLLAALAAGTVAATVLIFFGIQSYAHAQAKARMDCEVMAAVDASRSISYDMPADWAVDTSHC